MRTLQTARPNSTAMTRYNQRFANLIDRVSAGNDKKTRKKRRPNRSYWGKPKVGLKRGFDAFAVKKTTVTQKGKTVVSIVSAAPETGIHSRAWAEQIVPQGGFLALPIEIRHRIYEYLLDDQVIENPRKRGTRYIVPNKRSTTIQTYNFLTQTSRQTYVDVVGGGLLYHFARFAFSSTDTMTRYLACINPAHKATLRKVTLSVSLTAVSPAIRPSTFTALASIPNLQSLRIVLNFTFNICNLHLAQPTINGVAYPRKMQVRADVVSKLQDATRWEALKGLTEFHMTFQGNPTVGAMSWNYNMYSRHYAQSWQDQFYADDPRLLEAERGIREVVTKDV